MIQWVNLWRVSYCGNKKWKQTNCELLQDKTTNLKQIQLEACAIYQVVYEYQNLNKDRNKCCLFACLWSLVLLYYTTAIDSTLGLSICIIYSYGQWVIWMKVSIICSCSYSIMFHLLGSPTSTLISVRLIWVAMTRWLYWHDIFMHKISINNVITMFFYLFKKMAHHNHFTNLVCELSIFI